MSYICTAEDAVVMEVLEIKKNRVRIRTTLSGGATFDRWYDQHDTQRLSLIIHDRSQPRYVAEPSRFVCGGSY